MGLDLEGLQTFDWQASETDGALEVPKNTLDRWSTEREAFKVAYLRYKRVLEEIDELLYRAENARARPKPRRDTTPAPASSPAPAPGAAPAQALASAVAQSKAKYR